ncbi:hypothetical protein Tco_0764004 [Tanacetum coccineum]
MFDIDYLTDSMNYIPVSLENQANPHAGASEVTNSAGTPTSIASEEKDEEVELIVVPSAVNTGRLDHDDSLMPELEIFHKPETGIFDEASYDEEGVITDFNSLPTEIENKSGAHALLSHIQKQQRNNHKDQQHCLFAVYTISERKLKRLLKLYNDDSWVQAMQEELVTGSSY